MMHIKLLSIAVFIMLSVVHFSMGGDESAHTSLYSEIDSMTDFMKPYQVDKTSAGVEKSAVRWSKHFLADPYLPPTMLKYVFLPGSGTSKHVDMLRLRYGVGEETITVTQAASLFGIVITSDEFGTDISTEEKEEIVQKIARRLFRDGSTFVLKNFSQCDERLVGGCDHEQSSELPRWLENALWWWDNGEVGFIFIKDNGKATASFGGYGAEFNRSWFTGPKRGNKGVSRRVEWERRLQKEKGVTAPR